MVSEHCDLIVVGGIQSLRRPGRSVGGSPGGQL